MSNSVAREPWFLEGRRSVLQRAILTSVVLAGLGFLAGLVWLAAAVILVSIIPLPFQTTVFVFGFTGSVALALVVAVPYLHYRETLTELSVARVCNLIFFTAVLSGVSAILSPPMTESTSHAHDVPWLWIPFAHLMQFVLIWLVWCVVMIRPSWSWLFMSGLSACSLLAVPCLIFVLETAMNRRSAPFPQFVQQTLITALSTTITSQFLVILVVPWGIPFWFPPERKPAPQ